MLNRHLTENEVLSGRRAFSAADIMVGGAIHYMIMVKSDGGDAGVQKGIHLNVLHRAAGVSEGDGEIGVRHPQARATQSDIAIRKPSANAAAPSARAQLRAADRNWPPIAVPGAAPSTRMVQSALHGAAHRAAAPAKPPLVAEAVLDPFPRHCQSCREARSGLRQMNRPGTVDDTVSCRCARWTFCASPRASIAPGKGRLCAPARAAYSHSASLSSRKRLPVLFEGSQSA